MIPRLIRAGVLVLAVAAVVGEWSRAAETATPVKIAAADQAQFFEKQVLPILKANCFACHGGEAKIKGGLNLTSRDGLLKGGDTGPALDLVKPAQSLIARAVHYDELEMPPKGKLPQAQIDVITKWVEMGAPWSEGAATKSVKHGPPPVNAETMAWWSFQPVKKPSVPTVKNAGWVANPIDSFVLAKLESVGLAPVGPASKAALIRRVTYDLIGLPPTPDEVDAFVADPSPGAYEHLIDRLLASPHYGERWGRHWLDVVRYAETNSFERDGAKPFVWRYRDYVINSLNADKPYDRFVREQIAGDELFPGNAEALVATGFYRLGLWDDEPADPEQARYDELDDIVTTTGQSFLGLTVNCARCHDHKIDPIPQKDYYRFLAFFQGIQRYGVRSNESVDAMSIRPINVELSDEEKRTRDEEAKKYKIRINHLNEQLAAIEKLAMADFSDVEKEDFASDQNKIPLVKKRVPKVVSEEKFKEYERLTQKRDQLLKTPPAVLAKALCITEVGRKAPPTTVMLRGNPHVPGDDVEPGFPSVLAPPAPALKPPAKEVASSGRRSALAEWLTNPANPLTARVMVNRVWQHHFGHGIVRTPSDFGFQGKPPTHPELLDWLAAEFVAQGWHLKPLHKLMLMSNTYRLAATGDATALATDPENDLYWRFDMRRLDAEEVRDSILAVTDKLNRKVGGPSVYPKIPAEVHAGQSVPGAGWPTSPAEVGARRSVYAHVKRSLPLPILASFDAPDGDGSCPARFATTQPTQALSLLNGEFLNEQARAFAAAVRKAAGDDPQAQVRFALRRVTQREPSAKEIARGVAYMTSVRAEHHLDDAAALKSFCLLVLNLNEFVFLD